MRLRKLVPVRGADDPGRDGIDPDRRSFERERTCQSLHRCRDGGDGESGSRAAVRESVLDAKTIEPPGRIR
jgi:hypothetical protein